MSRRSAVWLCMIVIIAVMFYGLTPMVAEQDSVYRTYAPLIEVDALIHHDYVAPIRGDRLVDGAIRGMLLDLDRYSGYVAPQDMPAFERRNTGRYVGIGVVIGAVDNVVSVIAPFEDGPAVRAGVRAGDVILAVDGRSTQDLSVFDIEGMLVGRPNTRVTVTCRRPDGETYEVTIVRRRVQRHSVKGFRYDRDAGWDYFVDPRWGIAYIRVTDFSGTMIDEFDEALRHITRRRAAGLVIDLRRNPGGLFPQAVALLDRFIDRGTLVSTVTRRHAVQTYTATSKGTLTDLPLAVLVDHGSASAAEIVAGAMQDHRRATIIGERTFGKGSVQNFIRLKDRHAGVKLTVAYYRLPGGRIIHKTSENADTDQWGVIPDIVVPRSTPHREPERGQHQPANQPGDPQLREAVRVLTAGMQVRGAACAPATAARSGTGCVSSGFSGTARRRPAARPSRAPAARSHGRPSGA